MMLPAEPWAKRVCEVEAASENSDCYDVLKMKMANPSRNCCLLFFTAVALISGQPGRGGAPAASKFVGSAGPHDAVSRAEPKQSGGNADLQAKSQKFWDLIEPQAKLQTIARGFGFTEGPVWDSRGFLYVSDELTNKIFKLYPNGRHQDVLRLGDPDGNTFDRRHRLIDCASVLRAVIAVDPGGKYTVLADRFEGKKFNSPNDVVLGPDHALYFTDPTLGLPKGQKQEMAYQGVFRLNDEGALRLLIRNLEQPNGLVFSPDGTKLYVDDTARRDIHVYEVLKDGNVRNERLFAKLDGPGVPDGMRVDVRGNLFVTGQGGVWVFDASGHQLGTILIPEQAANLAWGDSDWKTLYITSSTSVVKIRTKTTGFIPYR